MTRTLAEESSELRIEDRGFEDFLFPYVWCESIIAEAGPYDAYKLPFFLVFCVFCRCGMAL
jgi:hypothetical protein